MCALPSRVGQRSYLIKFCLFRIFQSRKNPTESPHRVMKELVEEILAADIIEPLSSAWASRLHGNCSRPLERIFGRCLAWTLWALFLAALKGMYIY